MYNVSLIGIVTTNHPLDNEYILIKTQTKFFKKAKRAGGVAHKVDQLPTKCKALSSNSCITKIKFIILATLCHYPVIPVTA
jgi:hypothetical protein